MESSIYKEVDCLAIDSAAFVFQFTQQSSTGITIGPAERPSMSEFPFIRPKVIEVPPRLIEGFALASENVTPFLQGLEERLTPSWKSFSLPA